MSGPVFDPVAEATQLRRRLERLAARPAWGKSKIFLRIAVPNLREVLRERAEVLADVDDEDLARFATSLWNGVTYDEMHVAVEVLRMRPSLVTEPLIDQFLPGVDNRSVADDLASVVREWVAGDPGCRFPVLEGWAASNDPWTRWLALAATVALSRRGEELDRTLVLIESVVDDRRPIVTGGVSLALRQMIKSDAQRVEDFVESHADDLPARVRLEVWNKLTFGRTDGKPARQAKRSESRTRHDEAKQARKASQRRSGRRHRRSSE